MFQAAICVLLLALTVGAGAQQPRPPVNKTTGSKSRIYDRQTNHWHFIGQVELEHGDTKIYADDVEAWVDQNRVVAKGNVLLIQGNNRIAANRADFNLKTRLGTFYNAWGIAAIQ